MPFNWNNNVSLRANALFLKCLKIKTALGFSCEASSFEQNFTLAQTESVVRLSKLHQWPVMLIQWIKLYTTWKVGLSSVLSHCALSFHGCLIRSCCEIFIQWWELFFAKKEKTKCKKKKGNSKWQNETILSTSSQLCQGQRRILG